MRATALALALTLGACAPVEAPRGAAPQAPQLTATRLIAADGAALPLTRWLPAEQPRAVVLALHGINDYANAFATAGAAWARAGIATYAYDQRGFGAAPDRGLWPGTDALVDDAAAALNLLRARHPGVPVFVAGESMGGAVILAALGRGMLREADGVVLLAPAVRGWRHLPAIARPTLTGFAHTLPGLAGGVPGDFQPTDNPQARRALGADPLIIREIRVDAAWGLVNLMDEADRAAARADIPLLLVAGARDRLIPDGPIGALIAALPQGGQERLRVAIYREGFHLLTRDRNRDVVIADIAHWLLTRRTDPAAPLPSGADRR
jgi:alpha-beta hydrolase superfamily lysophospholipase